MVKVTVWNEFRHEKSDAIVREIYPQGMHVALARALTGAGFEARTATLDEPEHGLSENVLAETDVLTWWGHVAHHEVDDAIVDRVQARVLEGMGLIVLHSGHFSKIFRRLMGTTCGLKWREANEKERIWTIQPSHPIAEGVPETFVLEHHEMYGERFDIPEPDETVFISWYQGGEVFRSGCTFQRGHGRIFYFSPGHETYPIYHQPEVVRVIQNACRWAAARVRIPASCPNAQPLERIG